MTYPPF
jgi:tropomyosin 1